VVILLMAIGGYSINNYLIIYNLKH
jgi:hypothetical protein